MKTHLLGKRKTDPRHWKVGKNVQSIVTSFQKMNGGVLTYFWVPSICFSIEQRWSWHKGATGKQSSLFICPAVALSSCNPSYLFACISFDLSLFSQAQPAFCRHSTVKCIVTFVSFYSSFSSFFNFLLLFGLWFPFEVRFLEWQGNMLGWAQSVSLMPRSKIIRPLTYAWT